jgi:hypothetical protein
MCVVQQTATRRSASASYASQSAAQVSRWRLGSYDKCKARAVVMGNGMCYPRDHGLTHAPTAREARRAPFDPCPL